MRQRLLYTDLDLIRVTCVHHELISHGVQSELKNTDTLGAFGELPPSEAMPQVWVAEIDYARAEALVKQYFSSSETIGEDWQCEQCGEMIEGQYGQCWKCGYKLLIPMD